MSVRPLIKPLSAYEAASLGVDTRGTKGVSGGASQPLIGKTDAPAVEISTTFVFQSYFDSTKLQNAILAQPQNSPIVPSTMSDPIQVSGYGVGLHPSSETPIAIQFGTGGQQGGSQTYRLAPGQVIRPFGIPLSGKDGSFSSLQFGLPFGWLGGGSALLVVLRTPDAKVEWNSVPEIIFHRQRIKILTGATLPATTALPYNWPKRFPWTQAVYNDGTSSLTQRGPPALGISPTRTALRLRTASLLAAADMMAIWVGTNDFDLDSAGAVTTTAQTGQIITWGTWAQPAGAANLLAIYQSQMLTGQIERYAADDGCLIFCSDDANIQGLYVDVTRYGKVG